MYLKKKKNLARSLDTSLHHSRRRRPFASPVSHRLFPPSPRHSSPRQGDATYIIVKSDGSVADFGLNAVCTHLGCVVPWNAAENKFKCPCHGSQYNDEGKVIRGPAPLSLALAHLTVSETDVITFSPWTETDFRTGLAPWWK